MDKMLYYILDNFAAVDDPSDLKAGIRIISFTGGMVDSPVMEDPYNSVSLLIKDAMLYKKVKTEAPSRAEKIIDTKYIPVCPLEKTAVVSQGEKYSIEYLSMIQHVIKGRLKSNKITGVHVFNPQIMRIMYGKLL